MKKILLLIYVSTLSISLFATHNRAGEITYRFRSDLVTAQNPYPYEITLTTYTKGASSSADRCELSINFGDGDSAEVKRSNGIWGGSGVTDPWGSGCSDAFLGEQIGNTERKKNVYGPVIHNYKTQGSFTISMMDKNRNSGIANIPNSVDVPFYIESLLIISNNISGIKNSSPVLYYPPIDNACVASCFYHNPVAYDVDGDSISYELTACKTFAGASIPGYTFPPASSQFMIDPLKGDLYWCSPPQQGEYNIAFWIKEYRKGVLIGRVLRDMQIDVSACNNDAPLLSSHKDTFVVAGNTINIPVYATDVNSIDVITLRAYGGAMKHQSISPDTAIFQTTSGNNSISSNLIWSPKSNLIRPQPYSFTFKVDDDGKSAYGSVVPLSDIETVHIKVLSSMVGLSVFEKNKYIQLPYPNPVSIGSEQTIIIPSASGSYIEIYNIKGQLVYVATVVDERGYWDKKNLDGNIAPPGNYFIHVSDKLGNQLVNYKLLLID